MQVGIVTGLQAEADAFCAGAGETVHDLPFPVRLLGRSGHRIAVASAGIGKVNAATAATALVLNHQAQLLLVIGTAGKLSALAGDCFWLAEALQHDYGAARPGSFAHFSAGEWPIGEARIAAFAAMADPGTALPHARIATGDAFVECPDHSRRLTSHLAADLVDMETAAVAQVAARFGLTWAAIKATTDEANGDSAGDFQANLAAAAARSAAAADRLVGMLVNGL